MFLPTDSVKEPIFLIHTNYQLISPGSKKILLIDLFYHFWCLQYQGKFKQPVLLKKTAFSLPQKKLPYWSFILYSCPQNRSILKSAGNHKTICMQGEGNGKQQQLPGI